MPIYEYECRACGSVQEFMQKVSDPAPEACPACSKGPLVKLLSRTGFILKGEGWYVTDFRDKGKAKAKPKSENESGESKSDAKTDAKADAKSDSTGGASDKAEAKPAPKSDTPTS